MKQTEKVSIGGYSFTLERDAYERLNGYLEDIRSTYESNSYAAEITSDIEQRIAELFIEKGGKDGIVDYAMVDAVIRRIGSPAELADEENIEAGQTAGKPEDTSTTVYPDGPKRLFRDKDNKMLGGVCSGMAAYFHMDVVAVRLIAVGIVILTGLIILLFRYRYYNFEGSILSSLLLCIIAYAILWMIIPPARTVEEKCRMTGKPIELKQFKRKFENMPQDRPQKNEQGSPALHTLGRVISIAIGIILITTGIGTLIGCTTFDLVRDLAIKELGNDAAIGYYGSSEMALQQLLLRPDIWWIGLAIAGLFAVWLIYNGVLLTFNLKAPRWRPGTIIFILWIISLLVFTVWIIRRLLIIGSLM